MSAGEIANIYSSINNIQLGLNEVTGNTFSNYNQLSRIVSQQANIYNAVYYGSGNIVTGNLVVNSVANISGNLTLPSGNLILTRGNILSTVGNVQVSNGNVRIATGNLILSNGSANINGNLITSGISFISNTNLTYPFKIVTGNADLGSVGTGFGTKNNIPLGYKF